ncbi:AAA family ATPase [Caviibacterium pharyngocola]|uniref:Transcriptional regulator n=1 Tax=Caviibacterium pharyngocola TaxID=28159 RepID=A0A2M8RY24_9PAST|nr:AAA family ATPase [Caviibacterium pharyngocola]PJG83793.1 transcriptional regulator [Caviibacterium pharyngocola]
MKEQLQQYMQENGLTQQQIANAVGKSVAVINQYLKGTYKGKTDEVDEAVKRLIGRQKDKVVERKFNTEFVPTFAAESCLDAIHIAHVEGDIAVITGAAGLGKTQALKRYVECNPETIFIEVEPSCNAKVLLKTLCQQLGVNDTGLNHDLFTRIVGKLSDERLIIVDEAELLSTKCLEYLRRIHDLAKCGVVLAGMPRLLINLKGKYGELAQLYSRVGIALDLGNALSAEDVALLAEKGLGTAEFNELLFKVCKGNARRLNKLMRGAVRIAEMNQRPLDAAIINRYAEMLID